MTNDEKIIWINNFFKGKGITPDEITLIGIRQSKGLNDDIINDYIGYVTSNSIKIVPGTTEPGVYWTKDKAERNKSGTFHLSLGYHEKIWCIGTHKGYEALVNDYRYCKPTRGWRDKDYDFTRDPSDVEVCDYFGINFHRMHPIQIVNKIGKYSAGCQVIQNPKDFADILHTIKTTNMYLKNSAKTTFSYYLFDISEVPEGFVS